MILDIIQEQHKKNILSSKAFKVNTRSNLTDLTDLIKGSRRAIILLPDGIQLCINDTLYHSSRT